MVTAADVLAEYGISMQEAHDWIMQHIDSPETIVSVAQNYNITNHMLAEIVQPSFPGVSAADVKNFFASQDIDSTSLDNLGGGPIVGSWIIDTDDDSTVVISFRPDGSFALLDHMTDPDGTSGFEEGNYSYSEASGALTLTVEIDTDGDAGLGDNSIQSAGIEGNELAFYSLSEGDITATRLERGEGNSLVGSFGVSEEDQILIHFLDDSTYLMYQNTPEDESGRPGIEAGTYSWNQTTGEFVTQPSVDTNGEWGLSHSIDGQPLQITEVTSTEISFYEPGFDENFTFSSIDQWLL